jgi:hypothetical protein
MQPLGPTRSSAGPRTGLSVWRDALRRNNLPWRRMALVRLKRLARSVALCCTGLLSTARPPPSQASASSRVASAAAGAAAGLSGSALICTERRDPKSRGREAESPPRELSGVVREWAFAAPGADALPAAVDAARRRQQSTSTHKLTPPFACAPSKSRGLAEAPFRRQAKQRRAAAAL